MNNRFFALTLAVVSLPSCQGPTGVADLAKAFLADDVRCFSTSEDLTVISPYSPFQTAQYVLQAQSSLDAIGAALEIRLQEPLILELEMRDPGTFVTRIEDGVLTVQGNFEPPSHRGIFGMARSGGGTTPYVRLYVPTFTIGHHADGRRIESYVGAPFKETLRHEIAHVHAFEAGLTGMLWFSEGLAQVFEYCDVDKLELTPLDMPKPLEVAVEIHDAWTIADVLDWEEDVIALHEGRDAIWGPGRPLAYALMRFLLEQDPDGSWRQRFERVYAMSREELLALEAPWHRWLEETGNSPAPADPRTEGV